MYLGMVEMKKSGCVGAVWLSACFEKRGRDDAGTDKTSGIEASFDIS